LVLELWRKMIGRKHENLIFGCSCPQPSQEEAYLEQERRIGAVPTNNGTNTNSVLECKGNVWNSESETLVTAKKAKQNREPSHVFTLTIKKRFLLLLQAGLAARKDRPKGW